MRQVIDLTPTTNYQLASVTEREDAMKALARQLMGLSHGVQFVARARECDYGLDWPRPPRLERTFHAVVGGETEEVLGWRTRTLKEALEGVGLRCDLGSPSGPVSIAADAVGLDTYLTPVNNFPLSDESSPVRPQVNRIVSAHGNCASLVLRRWPREVAPGWLGQALSNDLPVDVALHVQPQDPHRIARDLKRQEALMTEDDAGHRLARHDAVKMRERLVARVDRPIKVATAFTVRAPDEQKLRERVALLGYEIGLTLGDARVATFEQDRGLEATELTGQCNLLGAWHTLDCTSVASTWIFQPATVHHRNGAPLGTSHGMLVKLDPFDESLESFGGVILAKVGAGKSYLLKLIARRLKDVEVLIVQQRSPNEYAGIEGAHTLDLATSSTTAERAQRLRDFVSALWETAKRDPRPRLLILDELWSLLRDPGLAALVEEVARIGRHHWLSLWIATQQVEELLSSEQGLAVLNNAAIRVYLKQSGPDGELLAQKLRLSSAARQYLRSAARGQALLDVGGMLIPVDIQASAAEHEAVSTDPREKHGRLAVVAPAPVAAPAPVGPEGDLVAAGAAAVGDRLAG